MKLSLKRLTAIFIVPSRLIAILIAYSLFLLFLAIIFFSCSQPEKPTEYPLQVGDIAYDASIDDENFKVCDENRIAQYYNFGQGLQYEGEKLRLNQHFLTGYKPQVADDASGFITIRFIVNCHGQTGRFRMVGMDNEYNEKSFDEDIATQLLELTRQLNGWIVPQHDGQNFDYYQYLTFKIEKGELIEIMP